MTTPKLKTVSGTNGARYYIHPETEARIPGVTSVLNMLPKQDQLKAWAAKEVSGAAVANYAELGTRIAADPVEAQKWLKAAPDRMNKRARDTGDAVHGIFERLALGETLGQMPADIEPYARQCEDLLAKVEPTVLATEESVVSLDHDYGGSFDMLLETSGVTCVADLKTSGSGVYLDTALQLSAYAHAEYVFKEGGNPEFVENPCLKASDGIVFWVRPDGWKVYIVPIGDDVFAYFKHLRAIFDWKKLPSKLTKPVAHGSAELIAAGGVL